MMVFCADKLDPLRGYDSSSLIQMCNENLEKGFDLVIKQNKEYLQKAG